MPAPSATSCGWADNGRWESNPVKRPLAGTVLVYAAGIWVGSFLPVDWPVLAGLVGLLLGMFGAAHYAAAGSRPGSRWEPRARWVLWLLVFVTGSLVFRVTADHDPSNALDRFLEGQPRQVTLRGEGDFDTDRIVLIGDRLYVITQFESALAAWRGGGDEEDDGGDLVPMELICYQIGESPGR